MSASYKKGRAGEQAALLYLQQQGYQLLARNFRARAAQPLSEIDLIFLAAAEAAGADGIDEVVVFVEVKNWCALPLADLPLNLTPARQRRMFETARVFLQRHPEYLSLPRRFDLLLLRGSASEPIHIKAAFP